jgi:hypothetical protein
MRLILPLPVGRVPTGLGSPDLFPQAVSGGMTHPLNTGGEQMIGKGIFHTNIVVRDLTKSLEFYAGLLGMEQTDFRDGDLIFLTTPGRGDVLTLNPSGRPYGFPGGCAKESER